MRYVDDTFVILHRDAKDNFKRELDSVFPQIQFTMEDETNGILSFLDVQVSRQEDGTLQTGVFRKATDTEKIPHYNSNHPLSHKRSCVRTLFHRIHTHCSTEAEKLRERKTLWHLFLANGYPRSFVNKCLYRRHTKTDGEKKQRPEIFRVLPYVRSVSEATERMLRPLSVSVGHRPEATIRRLIMQPKDRLPPADTSGVIYRVKCLDCPANYCGMTDKRVRTRMHEHNLAVRRKDVRSRNSTVQALKNRNKFSTLSGDEKKALNSLKTDENIIILPADKGGSTTIMNKTDYTEKMMTLLKDESTYEPLDADPTKSQNSCIEKTLKRLTGKKLISGDLAKSLKQDEPTIAKIYGLPKVHKIGIPLLPIVSLIGAPNYQISKWLFHHLHPLTKDSENSIEDSNEFLDKLNGVSVATDEIMVSFDVVSLFTSIPLDLARQCTEELLQTYTTDVPADPLLQLLDVCLETNFSFAKQCYRQRKAKLHHDGEMPSRHSTFTNNSEVEETTERVNGAEPLQLSPAIKNRLKRLYKGVRRSLIDKMRSNVLVLLCLLIALQIFAGSLNKFLLSEGKRP
ncbi:hypothetical protein SprV_0802468400 [Sparganum proliferum]